MACGGRAYTICDETDVMVNRRRIWECILKEGYYIGPRQGGCRRTRETQLIKILLKVRRVTQVGYVLHE